MLIFVTHVSNLGETCFTNREKSRAPTFLWAPVRFRIICSMSALDLFDSNPECDARSGVPSL